jgi:hypothetical protein
MERYEICTEPEAQNIVDELLRRRGELVGREIEIERRYPALSAGYRGRIVDIQLRNEQIFINIELKPKEVRPFLIGSKDPRFAHDIIKHIKRTRIKIR